MRLKRIKLNSDFRSLKSGFELDFLYEKPDNLKVNPYCIVGRNGSGKSNILELLASIFYNIELSLLVYKPPVFEQLVIFKEDVDSKYFIEENISYSIDNNNSIKYVRESNEIKLVPFNEKTYKVYQNNREVNSREELAEILPLKLYEIIDSRQSPDAYELEYYINQASVRIIKNEHFYYQFYVDDKLAISEQEIKSFLPEYVIGYSSGENEILSLPFFKMRLIQFDEYINSIDIDELYKYPESRMIYLDEDYSQAIFLCNFLFQKEEILKVFSDELGINRVKSFRIVLKKYLLEQYGIDILDHLNKDFKQTSDGFIKIDGIIDNLIKCATSTYYDKFDQALILDFYVNNELKNAFYFYFKDENNQPSALKLFQLFQILILLNQYNVNTDTKNNIYQSNSLYLKGKISNTIWDEMIFKFKNFMIEKNEKLILSKSLSDGEHQFLHTIGLSLIYKNTSSLFLLDEPETHFNPDWRAKYISVLEKCFKGDNQSPEILISSHSPFIVSDTKRNHVLIFDKTKDGIVNCKKADFNTFGASVNKITMEVFGKKETIGNVANSEILKFKSELDESENIGLLIDKADRELGESVEKILLLRALFIKESQLNNPLFNIAIKIKRSILGLIKK